MTAGELLARVDELRPNTYGAALKLEWLRRLDGQILEELERTHACACEPLSEHYDSATVLRAPFPYAGELYTAYLFCQIDLHSGEIAQYNQSLRLLSAAWRQFADWLNRSERPKGVPGWRF